MLAFNQDLVIVNMDAVDAQSVIRALSDRLYQQGLVSADYADQTWTRELAHPTGLPTRPFCIAFPHADSEGVNHSALSVGLLKKPVIFKNMADPDEDLEVHIVLLLANKSPEEQIETLRNLALLFGEPEKLTDLRNQTTAQNVYDWLKIELKLI